MVYICVHLYNIKAFALYYIQEFSGANKHKRKFDICDLHPIEIRGNEN